ncbi:MAG: LamG domain-containing protein [Bacteroidetes bacterium]|nr:LamG domain-containing protein [Bacteroidota bacterium]
MRFGNHLIKLLAWITVFLVFQNPGNGFCQNLTDSIYLPQVQITSLNGFGPYVIGTERSNLFILYQLPAETSKIIMKMIDSKGEQIGGSYTLTGTNLQTAEWSFESDTMGFPLSPQFYAEIHYQTDSVAIYKIPYTVYPDTAIFTASQGFGPFITNLYAFSDTSFHPVPGLINTFTFEQVPPRTDTIIFQILTTDSTVIRNSIVIAPPGTYLNSATYENVRMDVLPLNTGFLRTIVFCEGGPKEGLQFHKTLSVIPLPPRLICTSDNLFLQDSVGVFIQNQISGQALAVDSIKYAQIQNGPGTSIVDNAGSTIYSGPYSLDVIEYSFTIEAWMKFNIPGPTSDLKFMNLMTVDSVWQLYLETTSLGPMFTFACLADPNQQDLWSVTVDYNQLRGNGWHHLAFTCNNSGGNYPEGRFYLDGALLSDVTFDSDTYDYIYTSVDWYRFRRTQPFILGGNSKLCYTLVTAMDEVRIWSRALSQEEINYHFQKPPLQELNLLGYWDFDDLRNRLNYVSDKSYNNNPGILVNKAAFIPQYPGIQRTIDTLKIISSVLDADSVKYIFVDKSNIKIDSCTMMTPLDSAQWIYNMSSLPYSISKLKIFEYLQPLTGSVPETDYNLCSLAPEPIATPQYNWNCYYSTPPIVGKTFAPVTVSGFPNDTRKVILGLRNGNQVYDTMSFSSTSIPYHHSLTLNGSDNWIQTSQNIGSPTSFSILFWVKTTTRDGGQIIGFSEQQNGPSASYHDREIIMQQNGSLQVNLLSGSTVHTLTALSKNNDGEWHHVALTVDNNLVASLYVDGSLSDDLPLSGLQTYQGWWTLGASGAAKKKSEKSVAPFFHGSLSEISIWNRSLAPDEIDSLRFEPTVNPEQVLNYKMDDGTGTNVADHAGSNSGTVKGSSPAWSLSKKDISYVNWFTNITRLQPGTYTLFANVFYPFCPPSGANYSLGNFMVSDPFPGHNFSFHLTKGQGYFSQGMSLINGLFVSSDYSGAGQSGWTGNYIKYNFLTPDHELISSSTESYTDPLYAGQFSIDMGDASPGSYISLETGYYAGGDEISQKAVSIPIYIHPMIPPKVDGDFGPFDQAIAPGTMQCPNTFSIQTGPLTDIDSIKALFYNRSDSLIGSSAATRQNDSVWSVNYDMSLLSPPSSLMKLNYYLGQDIHPVVEGPYRITIRKTRPIWFDFLPASNFSNIQQSGSTVYFQVSTPFDRNWLVNDSLCIQIPKSVPELRRNDKNPLPESTTRFFS